MRYQDSTFFFRELCISRIYLDFYLPLGLHLPLPAPLGFSFWVKSQRNLGSAGYHNSHYISLIAEHIFVKKKSSAITVIYHCEDMLAPSTASLSAASLPATLECPFTWFHLRIHVKAEN